MTDITLAHSPDPDDVYMWWPITGMIRPPADPQRIEPAIVEHAPEIDTGEFRFVPIAADIAALNRHAIGGGKLHVSALSVNCWARLSDAYQLTSFGSSMGFGYGPKIVARSDQQPSLDGLLSPGAKLAIPGRQTTAFLLASMMLGNDHAQLNVVEMPFDHILEAVARNQDGITHGLLIHQSQLTFADLGLQLITDVGQWWLQSTGLPLPLGGNAIRRNLDAEVGSGAKSAVVDLLFRSLKHAMKNHDRSVAYAMKFAPELDRARTEQYLSMYVNDLTVDAGTAGERAIKELLGRGAELGLCPIPGDCRMARPSFP